MRASHGLLTLALSLPALATAADLPDGAVARWGSVRLRQGAAVGALAFSPDGKTVASAGYDGEVYLWHTDNGEARSRLLGHSGAVHALAFSPDGKRLASAGDDRAVRVWDADTGKVLRRLEGHTLGVLAVAFAPDGKSLASAGSDYSARVWDLETGKERYRLEGHDCGVNAVAFSPDGKLLASAGDDDMVRLWDPTTGKPLRKLAGHDGVVVAVAFSPDGKVVASGGVDGTLRLWRAANGSELRKTAAHEGGLTDVAFASDGKAVISAGRDAKVVRWDAATGKELARFDTHRDRLAPAAFSPDGARLAFASGEDGKCVHLMDALTGKELPADRRPPGPVRALTFALDGKALALADADGSVVLLDATTAKELSRFKAYAATGLTFAPGRGVLAITGVRDSERLSLWDAASGKHLRDLTGREATVFSDWLRQPAAFTPDGKVVVAPDSRESLRLWDAATGKEVRTIGVVVEQQHAQCFALSPDGRTLAVGYPDGQVLLWDADTGKLLRPLPLLDVSVRRLAFSPDGRLVAAVGTKNVVWNGHALTVWEVSTGGRVASYTGHDADVTALAWGADGRTVATGSADRSVRLWDLARGKEARKFSGHSGPITALAFAPDGRRLASASEDGTALVWDTPAAPPLAPTELTEKDLEACWADLESDDAAKAWVALWALAAAPKQSVPSIVKHVQPVPAIDEKRVARLFLDLDDDDFEVREKATAELKRSAGAVEEAARQEMGRTKSEEVRRRLGTVLVEVDRTAPASGRRALPSRALLVLEHAGTPEAQQALEKLAEGAPGAWQTREAKAALQRMKHRAASAN